MKINESLFRRILREESRRVLSESIMPMEDDGPFEPGDRVVVQRRGRPPETGRVVSRRRVSGISFSKGIMPSDNKYIYDVAFSVGGGRMGSRVERMIPGSALKRAGFMDSMRSGEMGDDSTGTGEPSAARSEMLGDVDFTRFSLRDAESSDDYHNTIDDIKSDIEEGKSVVITLDPLAAAMMAMYSRQYESGANRFVLTSESSVNLANFASNLSMVMREISRGSLSDRMFRGSMNEVHPVLIGIGVIGVAAIVKLILSYAKGEADSRRQARNQSQMLELARYSVENGCEVEVSVNSEASTSADDAVEGEVSDAPKGSAKGKGEMKNTSGGTIKVQNCRKA